MSLKAYDGMMTKNKFPHLYEKIKENMPAFEGASKKHIAKAFANYFIKNIDFGESIVSSIKFETCTDDDKKKLSEIKSDDITLLSYIFQCYKILAKSFFINDFTHHLNITIEPKGDRILVYPNIIVEEHRNILLTFLTDWYAQDQSDKPDNVTTRQWEMRCKDWYGFDEVKGFKNTIHLFDPNHYWDSLVDSFRGDELVKEILSCIPNEEERVNAILKESFINLVCERNKPEYSDNFECYFKSMYYLKSADGIVEFEAYKLANPVTLTKIDLELIKTKML